jgi:hypothetical protein
MKSDKATKNKRVEEVLTLRLMGAEFWEIRQYASEQEPPWNLSDRQLYRYIADGDELLARTLETDRKKLLNRHVAQRRTLFARAMAVSDYATARAVLKDEAELLHLYDAMPSDPKAGGDASPMDTAGVVAMLAARLRQVDQAELSTVEKSRLTATLADALLRAFNIDVLDKRLEALQAVLMGRKEQAKK